MRPTTEAEPPAQRPTDDDNQHDGRHAGHSARATASHSGRTADPRGAVVIVGSLNADLVAYCTRLPTPGETVYGSSFRISPGGKGANQAVAAARVGARVTLLGAVGADAYGRQLLDATSQAGVNISHVQQRDDAATGMALITVDATAENSIVIVPGANGKFAATDLDLDVIHSASIVGLCLELSIETVFAAAKAAHNAGALVILNLSPYRKIPEELNALTDVLLVNALEARQLLNAEVPAGTGDQARDAWGAITDRFRSHGLRRVVVTLGAGGSVVLDASANAIHPITYIAPQPVSPIDTTGAGDCFTGALAARLAGKHDLVTSARFASVASALATTGNGAQGAYPTDASVLDLMLG